MSHSKAEPVIAYGQEYRPVMLERARELALRGTPTTFYSMERIVAIQVPVPFVLHHPAGYGWVRGEAGDWLVTNDPLHPGPHTLWVLTDAQKRASYR